MTATNGSRDRKDFGLLTDGQLTRFLRLAIRSPRKPVEELTERLRLSDGPSWLEAALAGGPPALFGPPHETLADGKATLAQLATIKDTSKACFRGGDRETRLRALLGYFLAIAAGLAHHETLVSSQSRAMIDPILQDLAAVMPAPWKELLTRARASMAARDGSGERGPTRIVRPR